jgi:multiple sugar transport system permease protein
VSLPVASLLVPTMSLWLSRLLIFKWLGLLDSLGALIAPSVFGTSAFYVLILYWAFRRVPSEVYDAAPLGGCGPCEPGERSPFRSFGPR